MKLHLQSWRRGLAVGLLCLWLAPAAVHFRLGGEDHTAHTGSCCRNRDKCCCRKAGSHRSTDSPVWRSTQNSEACARSCTSALAGRSNYGALPAGAAILARPAAGPQGTSLLRTFPDLSATNLHSGRSPPLAGLFLRTA